MVVHSSSPWKRKTGLTGHAAAKDSETYAAPRCDKLPQAFERAHRDEKRRKAARHVNEAAQIAGLH
ncbi:MAG TPA: hypothetical protein PLX20_03050 [Rhodocyclaceae bacterium]|nr:hypothetical protein [Rhodocyclaceae bacterium]HNB78042.1 hypothetical protein [Rhodocyclaceae bacterium]HNH12081.1 hypothetical protein [Rhodocyclaceae bacterium]HNH98992.1 hypothetical protein [Rhodocyclaceae bacterium]